MSEPLGSLATADAAPDLRRGLWQLGIAMAHRDAPGTEDCLGRLAALLPDAEARSEAAVAVEEAILQCLLFLGFPAALTTLAAWRRISGRTPEDRPPLDDPPRASGEVVCQAVYGSAYPLLRERMKTLHPAANQWMVEDGYGKVMGRAGLDLVTRELLNVALLAATDFPQQLHSHLRGSLAVGASVEQVQAVLEEATAGLPPERREVLATLFREIATR